MAYLSDHGPISLGPGPCGHGEYHAAARELVDGVDVLVHDAQYTAAEFEARRGFGHSTVDYAVGLATECHVGSLLLFHHDPPRTDDELDAVVAGFASAPVRVAAAREGAVVMVART
jgi:ribonuclease BN (tRNA processing enzyme)